MRDPNGSRSKHHLLSCVSQMLNKANSAETTNAGMETVLRYFSPRFSPSLTSILHLSSLISITFSLIKQLPSPLPPFFFLSQERKNKQLSGSGLQMNSK